MDNLMQTVPGGTSQGLNSVPYIIQLINRLEGYKTRLKEIHWNAAGSDLVLHRFVDEIICAVSGFEDAIAENMQACYGVIQVGTLSPILPETGCPCKILKIYKEDLVNFQRRYKAETMYVGAIAIVEGAISEVDRLIYLSLPWTKE